MLGAADWPLLKASAKALFKGTHLQCTGRDAVPRPAAPRPSHVAGLAAGQEHDGILILRVGQPGPCAHAGVHGKSVFEVVLCVLPA